MAEIFSLRTECGNPPMGAAAGATLPHDFAPCRSEIGPMSLLALMNSMNLIKHIARVLAP